jgi:NUMOD3 motif
LIFLDNEHTRKYLEICSGLERPRSISAKRKGYHIHHIIPKSLDGVDEPENLVYATYSIHFDLHCLLLKMFDTGSEANLKMMLAIAGMGVTAEQYAIARGAARVAMLGNQFNKGRRLTLEHRAKISAGLKGHPNIIASAKNRVVSLETKEKHRVRMLGNQYLKGHKHSETARMKMSKKHKGVKKSIEMRLKLSATNTGKTFSVERKAAISAGLQKRIATLKDAGLKVWDPKLETRAKWTAANKRRWDVGGDLWMKWNSKEQTL